MFNLWRKKIPLTDAARLMAQMALIPLRCPCEEDFIFQAKAISEGIDAKCFTFEVIALSTYVVGAVINRERLEGRIKLDQAHQLLERIIQNVRIMLLEAGKSELLPSELVGDMAFHLLWNGINVIQNHRGVSGLQKRPLKR